MLQRIEIPEAFSRFQKEFRDYNENCEWYSFDRTHQATGRVTRVRRQKGTLKEPVKTTFYCMLTQYVHSYNRTAATMPAGMYTVADPPSLLTNCVRMAKYCDCSDRTVRNHLTRLKKLGVIATKFHGSNADFELWINPEILYGTDAHSEVENSENGPQNALKGPNPKDFPHTYTQIQNVEKEKKGKDMLVCSWKEQSGTEGSDRQADAGPPTHQSLPGSVAKKEGGAGRGRAEIAAHNDQLRREKAQAWLDTLQSPVPRGLDPRYIQMLLEFWLHAWKILYQKRDFSRDEQSQAIAAIAAGVYNNFESDRTPREWAEFQVYQLTKLDKAAKHYDNHPDSYLPDPYAVHVPGRGYFDQENIRGFVGIDAWMKKDALARHRRKLASEEKKAAKIKRNEALLRTARRDFEKLRAGLPPRKEMIGKTLVGLFHHYKTVFDGQGKKWLQRFVDQYIDMEKRDFKPPVYEKVRRKRALAGEKSPEIIYVEEWMESGEGWYS